MVVGDTRRRMLLDEEHEIETGEEKETEMVENSKEMVCSESFAISDNIPYVSRHHVVGYALTSKKTRSFLQPKLESVAR